MLVIIKSNGRVNIISLIKIKLYKTLNGIIKKIKTNINALHAL